MPASSTSLKSAGIPLRIVYEPTPTAARFHASNAFVRGIMGPIGSSKSVTCCWEIFTRAMEQSPSSDGIRRSRWVAARNSYPELKSTTIKTWLDWFPEHRFGSMRWDSPITHTLRWADVELEMLFLSLDRPDDVQKLLSLELTGFWANEAREMAKAIIDAATGRVGRYPSVRDGGSSWSGVIMDSNPPDDMHWWYELAEERHPEGWEFFRQPSALLRPANGARQYRPNPDAENIGNLMDGYNYYLRQVPGKDEQWIAVYIMGEYGTIMAGKPVYAGSWNDVLHVARDPIEPMQHCETYLGWDYGLTPACIIAQVTPRGRIVVTDEVIGDTGIRQFAQTMVQPLLRSRYHGFRITSVGDPAGSQRAQTDEKTVFDELRDLGIPTISAPSNNPLKRWESVRYYLTQLWDGEPALQISPGCKILRKGFNGGYRFRQLQVAGDTRFSDQAEKNMYSHPHDGLQCICLHLREGFVQKNAPKTPPNRPADSVAGY